MARVVVAMFPGAMGGGGVAVDVEIGAMRR